MSDPGGLTPILAVTPLGGGFLAALGDGRIAAVRAGANLSARVAARIPGVPAWINADPALDLLMVGDSGGRVYVGGLSKGKFDFTLQWLTPLRFADRLVDGRFVGLDLEGRVVIWAPAEGGYLPTLLTDRGSECREYQIAVRRDGNVVLCGGLDWRLWYPAGGQFSARFETYDGMQLRNQNGSLGVSANGEFYYLYWDDFSVWDASSGELVRQGRVEKYVYVSSLSDDGGLLSMGGEDGWIGVLNPSGELPVDITPGQGHIVSAAISSDGGCVAWLDSAGTAGLIDIASGSEAITRSATAKLIGSLPGS